MDYNPFPIEIFIKAFNEAENDKIIKYLPSKFRSRLDLVPEELCISKKVGWETEIVFEKCNLHSILNFVYQKETHSVDIDTICKQTNGDKLLLLGYWD